ncbi:helix-turn-helix transcriptional regulator [Micromonospora polyrhachis]|uniref:Transcriptional regulator with XRE-family HTH domain n=1 Tax=Micromonospora polyrhachis TaxID=1282883 RepID=A0A7W7SVU1_9ACTN|nr:helix-turn-helix transcriptional regulator [Micromonospora polyrhachis]MBB4960570.1 transcriptional regulator with XRE-family HTH domain [Micromonospora polyrhachis]
MDRLHLAEFLRSRRGRVQPGDVGLAAGTRRRTPGLRREEVARLAGISVDYYARLEQARGPRPSRQVLSALARALRLYDAERAHLYHLVGEVPAPPTGPSPDVPAGVLHLLDRLDDTPAYVIDVKYEILAWNRMAAALMGDPSGWPAERRNMVWNLFAGEYSELALTEPQSSAFADECVAELRAAAAQYPQDPGIHRLIARLRSASPEFVRRWEQLRVCVRRGSTAKQVRHPVVGELALECEVLDIAGHGQRLIIYSAVPGSPSAEALELLSVVGTQWMAEQPT